MAGDWIPFYVSTPRKSEVLQIARETNRNRHEVIGLLMEFWAWCQGETRDRLLPVSYTHLTLPTILLV